MATNNRFMKFLSAFGPDTLVSQADITLPVGNVAPVVTENQGFLTITKTGGAGTGQYTLVGARRGKSLNVTYGVQCASAAQTVVITSKNIATGTVVFTVVGAGTATPADPTTAITLNVQAFQRIAS